MDANTIYEQTMDTLTLLVTSHTCPDGNASIRAFAKAYKIGRQNLTAALSKKPGHDMSVGVFMRVCAGLGLGSVNGLTPEGHDMQSPISLRQRMQLNDTAFTRALLEVNFS